MFPAASVPAASDTDDNLEMGDIASHCDPGCPLNVNGKAASGPLGNRGLDYTRAGHTPSENTFPVSFMGVADGGHQR